MAFIKNPTDIGQSQRESAEFDSGVAVFQDAKTRSIPAADGGSAPRTSHESGSYYSNGGVMMPFNDKPGIDFSDKIGKA